jgi:hypothetical protein
MLHELEDKDDQLIKKPKSRRTQSVMLGSSPSTDSNKKSKTRHRIGTITSKIKKAYNEHRKRSASTIHGSPDVSGATVTSTNTVTSSDSTNPSNRLSVSTANTKNKGNENVKGHSPRKVNSRSRSIFGGISSTADELDFNTLDLNSDSDEEENENTNSHRHHHEQSLKSNSYEKLSKDYANLKSKEVIERENKRMQEEKMFSPLIILQTFERESKLDDKFKQVGIYFPKQNQSYKSMKKSVKKWFNDSSASSTSSQVHT